MGPISLKNSDPVELRIEKLVYGGEGLGRLDGQVVLVPFVLPGERVSVATSRVKGGLLRGVPLQVLEPASERTVPRCEYFANCGGCQYQHAEYRLQLEQKQAILRETLKRLGKIEYEDDISTLSGEPWHYRNRIQLHFRDRESGFHKAGSRELCPIDHCYISSPVLVEVIRKLQTAVKQPEWPEFLRSLEVFTNENQIQLNVIESARPVAARFFEWCGTFLPPLAPGPIEYPAAGNSYRVSRGSFFQVNRFLTDALVQETISETGGTHAIDLYAGVGLFTLSLAGHFEVVDAVERSAPAYRDLEWNVTQSGRNIRTHKENAENFLRRLTSRPDLIVADPPRAGLGRDATGELLRIKPPRLTLVSCDPATLARDVQMLLPTYRIARLALVDLFPQTYHFEVVAHLESTGRELFLVA
jgi:23S rRNA (uracil1939-C5)-methyltransferase